MAKNAYDDVDHYDPELHGDEDVPSVQRGVAIATTLAAVLVFIAVLAGAVAICF